MTDLRQAAQQALEALERYQVKRQDFDRFADEITALRTALAQQAEPPPEWPLIKNILAEYGLQAIDFVAEWKAAQRQWVGLTDEEIQKIWDVAAFAIPGWSRHIAYARATEAKLKEINSD